MIPSTISRAHCPVLLTLPLGNAGSLGYCLILIWISPEHLSTSFFSSLQYYDLLEIFICAFRWPKCISHIYLLFTHSSWLTLPKTLRLPLVLRVIKCLCHADEWLLDTSKEGALLSGEQTSVIRRLKLSAPPPDLLEQWKGWRLNLLPMANDLINQAYVMKPP